MRISMLVTLAALASGLLASCGDDERQDSAAPAAAIDVVATTTQVADLVANVAGERASVHGMLRPNADPHDYEPRPSDAEELSGAGLVVRSGGDLDDWLADLVESAGSEAPVLTLIGKVKTIDGGHDHGDEGDEHAGEEEEHASEDEEHASDEIDPHWWQNPRNAMLAVDAIRDALIVADPQGRDIYDRNAARYLGVLAHLDDGVATCLWRVPEGRRKLVTTHDALGYFADRYDIEVIGSVLDSLSTQAQPSSGDIQRLVDQMREEGVKVLFAESSVAPGVEEAIAREAGATVGGTLWADTLGPAGSSGETYVKSIVANADAMVRGFTAGDDACVIEGVG